MKKIFFLTILCFFSAYFSHAQKFQATTGTGDQNEKWATVEDAAAGGYVTIGNSKVGLVGVPPIQQVWISSYNTFGVVLTSAIASNGRQMIARDISLAPTDPNTGNRTYYVTGYTKAPNGINQMFVGRINLAGTFLWYQENPIGGNGNDKEGVAVTTAPNGDAVAVGHVMWPNAPVTPQIMLTRFAPGGAILWSNVYNQPGNWMVREIANGVPIPGFPTPGAMPGEFVITGEVRAMNAGAVQMTFAAAYNGGGIEGWRNLYPAVVGGYPTSGDAGYDILFNTGTGNYNLVGAAEAGPGRAVVTTTPYLCSITPGGALVAAFVYTGPNNQPLGLYPRCVAMGNTATQIVFAGPNFNANRTFYGSVLAIGGAAIIKDYVGLATANSVGQPFWYNDGQREDILYTQLTPNKGYLITTNALPVGAFGAGDGHFIRTDLAGVTPIPCPDNPIQNAQRPSNNMQFSGSAPTQLVAWGFQQPNKTPYPVQQQICRNICTVNPGFTYTTAGATVTFSNTSSGNGILSYYWDFGDLTNSTLTNPTHTYGSSGSYNVCLTVTNVTPDGDTCKATICKTVVISLCNVVSKFTDSIVCKYKVYNKATSTGTGPLTYNWLFDDGSTSTLANPIKIYTACGPHITRLITCNATCCDTIFRTVNIPCCQVKSDFCLQDSGLYVKLLYSTGMNLPTTTYTVYVDGVLTTWTANAYKLLTAGVHTICLKARRVSCPGDTCCATCCKTINVHANCKLSADFWYQTQTTGNVLFTNKTTPAGYTSVWDFGDGSPIVPTTSPSHIYTTPGTYTACLTATIVTGTDTCRSKICKTVVIDPPCKPLANFKSKYCLATPLTVEFINYSAGAVSYAWDFGDGNTSVLASPTHTYTATGAYIVCLTATATANCWSKTCYRVIVSTTSCDTSCTSLPILPTVKLGNNLIQPGEIFNYMALEGSISSANGTTKDNTNALKAQPGQINAEDKLSLFPNPAAQKVQVVFETVTEATGEITITNALGSLVYRKAVTMAEGKNQYSVPVNSFANGNYFLRINSGNKIQSTLFSVKN